MSCGYSRCEYKKPRKIFLHSCSIFDRSRVHISVRRPAILIAILWVLPGTCKSSGFVIMLRYTFPVHTPRCTIRPGWPTGPAAICSSTVSTAYGTGVIKFMNVLQSRCCTLINKKSRHSYLALHRHSTLKLYNLLSYSKGINTRLPVRST